MHLAEHLGKFLWEVAEAPAIELPLWIAYFQKQERERDKAQREAERDAKRGGKARGRGKCGRRR